MQRLFVAILLPEMLSQQLSLMQGGVPGARWEPAEKMHLTVRFIGDVDGGQVRAITAALERVRAPAFDLALAGAGHFPPRGDPKVIWIGVDDRSSLDVLRTRIDRALERAGVEPEGRNFSPHVTLARLHDAPHHKVAEFLQNHVTFFAPSFRVDAFALMSSILTRGGSKYRVDEVFPLDETPGTPS